MDVLGHAQTPVLSRPSAPFAFSPAVPALRESARDLRLDLLRGFCVFAMIVDHIGGHSWLYLLTGGNQFFVSAAEGFVFISGLVLGIVSAKRIQREGLRPAMRAVLLRARSLYLLTIVLTLGFASYVGSRGLPWGWHLESLHPLTFVVDAVTFYRTFYLADVLLLYTLLLLVAPGMLYLLAGRRALVLLAASWLLWAAYQFAPQWAGLPWRPAAGLGFQFAPWQVLFVTGLAIGFHRETVARRLGRLPRRRLLVLFALLFALLLAAPGDLPGLLPLDSVVFSKNALGAGRLIAFAITFVFAYLASDLFWRHLQPTVGRLLLPLGQNALYAYTLQFGVIALVLSGHLERFGYDPQHTAVNTLFQCAAIALVWLFIRRRVLFGIIPR